MLGNDLVTLRAAVAPFVKLSKRKIKAALIANHSECFDGMNDSDIGQDARLACIKRIPGLFLPGMGVVTVSKRAPHRPMNTSQIVIPIGTDKPIYATVNCVVRKGEKVYELTRKAAPDPSTFGTTDRMLDVEGIIIQNWMIAITRTEPRPEDGSVVYVARFLGGHIDFDRSLFFAEIDEEILTFDTRNPKNDLSRQTEADEKTNLPADGPKPLLRRRKRDTDNDEN